MMLFFWTLDAIAWNMWKIAQAKETNPLYKKYVSAEFAHRQFIDDLADSLIAMGTPPPFVAGAKIPSYLPKRVQVASTVTMSRKRAFAPDEPVVTPVAPAAQPMDVDAATITPVSR